MIEVLKFMNSSVEKASNENVGQKTNERNLSAFCAEFSTDGPLQFMFSHKPMTKVIAADDNHEVVPLIAKDHFFYKTAQLVRFVLEQPTTDMPFANDQQQYFLQIAQAEINLLKDKEILIGRKGGPEGILTQKSVKQEKEDGLYMVATNLGDLETTLLKLLSYVSRNSISPPVCVMTPTTRSILSQKNKNNFTFEKIEEEMVSFFCGYRIYTTEAIKGEEGREKILVGDFLNGYCCLQDSNPQQSTDNPLFRPFGSFFHSEKFGGLIRNIKSFALLEFKNEEE